jgi:hypothetical protein
MTWRGVLRDDESCVLGALQLKPEEAHTGWMDTELRAELLRRGEKDQAAIGALEDQAAVSVADAEVKEAVFAGNMSWLKQVIADAGWPGISLAGEDGASAAWLLAQHADHDPAFQRRCLDLLAEAAARGEASWIHVAYLTDRVLLAEGKPQEYGTQATGRDGQYVARDLRDPVGVDERRAQVGLGPLAGYLAQMMERYGPPLNSVQCPACGARLGCDPRQGEAVPVACFICGQAIP